MNFGINWEKFMGKCPKEEAEKIFNLYCDNGGNLLIELKNIKYQLKFLYIFIKFYYPYISSNTAN